MHDLLNIVGGASDVKSAAQSLSGKALVIAKKIPGTKQKTAKSHLKTHGWTQSQAAQRLGIDQTYLCRVLNGHMKSKRLVSAVMSLGLNPSPKKAPAYSRA